MDYEDALRFGGATVHEYESFGSYQGEWVAKVTYEGKTGWVSGNYGSCSGCDALQSEFGYNHHKCGNDSRYEPVWDGFRDGCPECQSVKQRFIDFGKEYLEEILTQEEIEKIVSKHIEWDMEAEVMLKYVKEHHI